MSMSVAFKPSEELSRTLQQIEKTYGKGAMISLSDRQSASMDCISTGSLSLDLALGGRGLPRGRIIELFGPESSGKTTLALHVVGEAQKKDGVAAFIDVEHALDPSWARRCGVDTESMLVSQPDSGEQALEITEMLVRSNAVDVLVIDSVAALIPRAELEGQMGDPHVALQARLMSQALRKLTAVISKSRCILIFINQIRMKIGVMFGNPETTTGGRALKFYSTVRLDVRRIGSIKEGETITGNHVRVKVVKNKVAAPFRQAEFDIMFDSGISREGDLLDLAIEDGFIAKSGSWFSHKSVRLGQGRENVKQFLRDNPDLCTELEQAVIAKRAPRKAEDEAKDAGDTTASKTKGSAPKPVEAKRKRA